MLSEEANDIGYLLDHYSLHCWKPQLTIMQSSWLKWGQYKKKKAFSVMEQKLNKNIFTKIK